MVYAGKTKSGVAHIGVSGRLKDRNLVMWDEETNSLWSQLSGEGIYGKRKGESLKLSPSVFVGFATWKKMAPKGQVLALTDVRAKIWHYTRQDLARGALRRGHALALGLRSQGETLAIPLAFLQKKRIVTSEIGGKRILALWLKDEMAPLVYRIPKGAHFHLDKGRLVQAKGGAFDPLTGKPFGKTASRPASPLRRFPYLPVLLKAWKTWYPQGRVLGTE